MTATKQRSADEILEAVLALLSEYCQQGQEESDSVDLQELDDDQTSVSASESSPVDQVMTQQLETNGQDSMHSSLRPWEDLTGLMPKGLNLPMPPALYAKMLWITNNVPKMSLQKIARAGAEAEADRLIALHYKL